ncbi:hypothetical protein [Herbidospora daliensis]|uniref:hypothetical protein n=1 Tax=Herbidospora daliensis TaxID=295585 RepID=UPI000A5EAA75|nr:hypothetical protein [Herbidospora daliensis]
MYSCVLLVTTLWGHRSFLGVPALDWAGVAWLGVVVLLSGSVTAVATVALHGPQEKAKHSEDQCDREQRGTHVQEIAQRRPAGLTGPFREQKRGDQAQHIAE